MRERSNMALSGVPKDLLVVGVVVLASTASFGLGMLAERELAQGQQAGQGGAQYDGFWIENVASSSAAVLPAASAAFAATAASGPAIMPGKISVVPAGSAVTPKEGKYVASKNGTKYYLPTCSGATRIKEANRVWFSTVADAQASGRTPASNCPGL